MSTIGDRLKNARENKMLSQIQVYKDTGIHNKTLSGYERGVSQPDLETIALLANYYDVSIDYLILENGKNKLKNTNYYKIQSTPSNQVSEDNSNYKIIEDIFSLSIENQEEIHKLVKLYKIKEEYEKTIKNCPRN